MGAVLSRGVTLAQTRAHLDPLTDAERWLVEGIAGEDARVRKLTSDGRVRLVYLPKPP